MWCTPSQPHTSHRMYVRRRLFFLAAMTSTRDQKSLHSDNETCCFVYLSRANPRTGLAVIGTMGATCWILIGSLEAPNLKIKQMPILVLRPCQDCRGREVQKSDLHLRVNWYFRGEGGTSSEIPWRVSGVWRLWLPWPALEELWEPKVSYGGFITWPTSTNVSDFWEELMFYAVGSLRSPRNTQPDRFTNSCEYFSSFQSGFTSA